MKGKEEHKRTRNINQKYEGDAPLGAQLNEMGGFEGRGGEEDAVVGDDAYGGTVDVRKTLGRA